MSIGTQLERGKATETKNNYIIIIFLNIFSAGILLLRFLIVIHIFYSDQKCQWLKKFLIKEKERKVPGPLPCNVIQ